MNNKPINNKNNKNKNRISLKIIKHNTETKFLL